MIIKSKSYKGDCYDNVIAYVLREADKDNGFILTRFIKGKDRTPESIAKEFRKNEQYRIHRRKNSVTLYMDIISFHKDDAEKLTDNAILKKIARKYMSLRSNLSIALTTVHRDKSHTHLHVLLSGTEYRTGKSIRISRADFKNKVKIPMETFQEKHFRN